jgi:hypothetical protein
VFITAAVWFCVLLLTGYIFSGGANVKYVTPEVMANVVALSFVFIPFFSTQGVLTGMMDGALQQRFLAPKAAPGETLRSRNPWLLAVVLAACFGMPAAAAGYLGAGGLPAETLTPGAFAWKLASFGVLLCGLTAFVVAGGPYLHETRVPQARRRVDGDAMQYVWARHVWPNTLVNLVINFAVAYALVPGKLSDPDSVAPNELVVGDTLVTCIVLCILMSAGVGTHARVDRAWGIAPLLEPDPKATMAAAVLPKLFAGVALTVAVAIALWLSGQQGLSAPVWAVYRGLLFGAYCGWLARDIALTKLRAPNAITAPVAT